MPESGPWSSGGFRGHRRAPTGTIMGALAELTGGSRLGGAVGGHGFTLGLDSLGDHANAALRFRGFEFNNSHEVRLASYARHIIQGDGWPEMADRFDDKHDHGNSHMPTLAAYQRMVSVWKPLWNKKVMSYGSSDKCRFTVEELQQLLDHRPGEPTRAARQE